MAGQNHHFSQFAPEKIPYAIKRTSTRPPASTGSSTGQLADKDFVAGSEYSIADMAIYPWIVSHKWQSQNLGRLPQRAALVQPHPEPPGDGEGVRPRGQGQSA